MISTKINRKKRIPLILKFIIGQAYENITGENINENTSVSLPLIKTT